MVDAFKVGRTLHHPRVSHSCTLSQPDYIAPIVGYLTSEANDETTGRLFEIMGGWAAQTRWQRAGGYGFPVNKALTPESVISKWEIITDFSEFLCVCEASYSTVCR